MSGAREHLVNVTACPQCGRLHKAGAVCAVRAAGAPPESLPERLAREALVVIRARAMGDARARPEVDPEDPDVEQIAAAIRVALDEVAAAIEGCDREVNRLADKIRALKGEVPPAP